MKKLCIPLIATFLTFEQAYALPRFKGKSPKTSSHTSGSTKPSTSTPAKDAGTAGIECDPGTSVTYGFINNITGGKPIDIKKDGTNLIVGIPEYFSACISKLKLESKIGEDNNVYFKFAVDPTTELRNSDGTSFERKYENCVEGIIKENPTLIDSDGDIDYDVADKLGLISRNKFRVAVDISQVDSKKDSEVIVASLDKTALFNSAVYESSPSGLGDSTEKSWNCMRFENPNPMTVRVYQTDKTRLIDQAEAICKSNNASAHDVEAIRAELLKSETLGNFAPLVRSLSEFKYNILKKEIDAIESELEIIEEKLMPSDEDNEDGRRLGVSNAEAKKLVEQYSQIMEKFNKNYLPLIKTDITMLLAEREDASDERIEKIDEEIKRLSELLGVFDRNSSDKEDRFKTVVLSIKEANKGSSLKGILEAVFNAKYLKQVYEGDKDERGDKLSLKKAEELAKKHSNDIFLDATSKWKDEKELKAGSDAPIKRRQKILAEIQKRAMNEKQQFSYKFQAQDQYIQQYLQRAQQTYCTSGGDMQKCMYVQQQLAPTIYNQYGRYKQQQAMQFQSQWSQKYGNAIGTQQNIIGNYQNMSQQYQAELMRKKIANEMKGLGTSSYGEYDYGFFDVGNNNIGGGLDFLNNMNFNMPITGNDQYMNYNLMPNQGNMRSPAGGTNFINPYASP